METETENEIALVKSLVEKFDLAVFIAGFRKKKITVHATLILGSSLSFPFPLPYFLCVPNVFPLVYVSLRTCELFNCSLFPTSFLVFCSQTLPEPLPELPARGGRVQGFAHIIYKSKYVSLFQTIQVV